MQQRYATRKVGEDCLLFHTFRAPDGSLADVSACQVSIFDPYADAYLVERQWATVVSAGVVSYRYQPLAASTPDNDYLVEWHAVDEDGNDVKSVSIPWTIIDYLGAFELVDNDDEVPVVLARVPVGGEFTVPEGSTAGQLVSITAEGVADTYATRAAGGPIAAAAIIQAKLSPTTARLATLTVLDGLEGLTVGPLYLGVDGALSATQSTTNGELDQCVGYAVSATRAVLWTVDRGRVVTSSSAEAVAEDLTDHIADSGDPHEAAGYAAAAQAAQDTADSALAALASHAAAADPHPGYALESALGALAALNSVTASLISDASANGRSLITAADYAAMRTLLGLVLGTNVQAYHANLAALSATAVAAINDLRLTGVSATPVMQADNAALSTIYATPYTGNRIALYNGTSWDLLTTAEVSLALSGRTAGTPFDIFAYNASGTVTLEFLDWANATTRATGITRQDGVWCKTGALTRRYLGTCTPNGASTFPWITDGDVNSGAGNTAVKLALWNANNRVRVSARLRDSGSSHSYSTTTTRAWNGSTNARFEITAGLQEESFEATLQFISNNTTTAGRVSGFGIDSTTVFSGVPGYTAFNDTLPGVGLVKYQCVIGAHYVSWLQRPYAGTVTWYGVADGSTALQSGAMGSWMC